jgi:hypothetical protein
MKEIQVHLAHGWIQLPYDLPLIDLALALALHYLRLRWNVQARRLEVTPIY